MSKITLSRRPTRDDLTAFAFASSVLVGLVVLVAGVPLGQPALAAATSALILLLGAGIGLLTPEAFAAPYRVWNGLARRYARMAQAITMIVAFHLVFTVVARGGTRFQRTVSKRDSGWSPKASPDLRTQAGYVPASGTPDDWDRRLREWSRGGASRWSLFLLPFLHLLDAFEGQKRVKTAEDIYTLY